MSGEWSRGDPPGGPQANYPESTTAKNISRRDFTRAALGSAIALSTNFALPASDDFPRSQPPKRTKPASKKLAVVTTAYHYLSHAYHICGRFLDGYLRGSKFHFPDWQIAGMYVAQQKENDLSREMAKKHGFTIYPRVGDALTLSGEKLAVDGVLLIGEHGDYPYNAKGQKLYPRHELFQQIVEVFRKSDRHAPVFCDKHLSYSWEKAKEMVALARQIGFPLMAGSSLPVTWRRPELELPLETPITEALVASRGELEIYGIHALEALQCMVERRRGGSPLTPDPSPPRGEGKTGPASPAKGEGKHVQGVKAVTCLAGDAVWKAGDAGVWSWELLEHALGRSDSLNVGDIRDNCRHYTPPGTQHRPFALSPVAFVVEYRDGLKATALLLGGHVDDTTFAARIPHAALSPKGRGVDTGIVSTLFFLPPPPGASFLQALAMRIEDFLATGKPPYPVERTLLTGGILDFALESRVRNHQRLETPDLDVCYDPPADSGFVHGDWRQPAGN